MKRDMFISSTALFVFSLVFALGAFSNEVLGQAETPIFTNKDIDKYKGPNDYNKTEKSETRDYRADKQEQLKKINEEREKEYWCKKASPYRRKIESTTDDIRQLEDEQLQANVKSPSGKKGRSISRRIQSTRKKLREAEKDLAELENEAYRKGVPQGWLRCQFE